MRKLWWESCILMEELLGCFKNILVLIFSATLFCMFWKKDYQWHNLSICAIVLSNNVLQILNDLIALCIKEKSLYSDFNGAFI